MPQPTPTAHTQIPGGAGQLDLLIDAPREVRGIALIGHPHPLFGGANTNKVVHTLARTFRDLGYAAVRPNFRGVGHSTGPHDHGEGETEDMLSVLSWARERWGAELPLALGGFSFGAFVQTRVANRLTEAGTPPGQVVLVGMAAGTAADGARHYATPPLPAGLSTLIIHGEEDDTVPLGNVFDWARPQELAIVVIPGAGHFFHARLHQLRELMQRNLPALPQPA